AVSFSADWPMVCCQVYAFSMLHWAEKRFSNLTCNPWVMELMSWPSVRIAAISGTVPKYGLPKFVGRPLESNWKFKSEGCTGWFRFLRSEERRGGKGWRSIWRAAAY